MTSKECVSKETTVIFDGNRKANSCNIKIENVSQNENGTWYCQMIKEMNNYRKTEVVVLLDNTRTSKKGANMYLED